MQKHPQIGHLLSQKIGRWSVRFPLGKLRALTPGVELIVPTTVGGTANTTTAITQIMGAILMR